MKRKKVTGDSRGEGDVPEKPEPACAVDPRRLFHRLRDRLQGRQIEGDIVSEVGPSRGEDHHRRATQPFKSQLNS